MPVATNRFVNAALIRPEWVRTPAAVKDRMGGACRWTSPAPGAADAVTGLEPPHREARAAQPVRHVQAREADDADVEDRARRRVMDDRVVRPVRCLHGGPWQMDTAGL